MLLKILLAALCVIGYAAGQESPVFIWGAATDPKPSLAPVSQEDFKIVLDTLLQKNTIVAFQEDNLSVSDLSCHNTASTKSCFTNLRNKSPKTYYANVVNPVDTLRASASELEFNSIDASGKLVNGIKAIPGKVIFVSFDKSSGVERGEALEAHDTAIDNVTKQLSGDIVYLYLSTNDTGNATKRLRRDTAATAGGYIFINSQIALFYTQLSYYNSSNLWQTIVINTLTVQNSSSTGFDVVMTSADNKILNFSITYSNGYYEMTNVFYDGVKFYNQDMSAPYSFSYHCGSLTLEPTTTSITPSVGGLQWTSLQFQAPYGSTIDPSTFVFGDSWDCVYFFTPGILSGLFVVTLLLIVLFTSICWLMDINTMDRFDDPKGKTITVQTAE